DRSKLGDPVDSWIEFCGGSVGCGYRPDLLEELEGVELIPVLLQAAVADSPDVDRAHLDLGSARRDVEERARVASAVGVAAHECLGRGDAVVDLETELLECG